MATPDEKRLANNRAINARISALKSVGRDDEYIADSLLKMDFLPDSVKSKIKQAKVEGKARQAISSLNEYTGSQLIGDNTTTAEDMKTRGFLGKTAEFLGIEKAGRRIGTTLAQLDPQHRRNLSQVSQQEQEVLKTGGVSGREFAGSLGNVALSVVPVGIGAKVLSNVAKGGRTLATATQGIKSLSSGKRALATGLATGYASDVAGGLEQGETTPRALVPGLGTVIGGTLGSVPGVASRFAGRAGKKEQKAFEQIVDTVAPRVRNDKTTRSLLTSGKATQEAPGLFREAKTSFMNDERVVQIAQATESIIDPKKNIAQNFNAVSDEISDIAENKVKPFLSENKVPFNFEDLRNRLNLVEPTGSLKSDPSALKNYNRVREEILDDMAGFLRSKTAGPENMTDMNELWNARKVLDQKIFDELGDATFGSAQYTGVKAAARDMRTAFANFITDSLTNPGQAEEVNRFYEFMKVAKSRGIDIRNEKDAIKLLRQQMGIQDIPENVAKGAFYKYAMDQMNLMYEAMENMAPKVLAQEGKNKLQLLAKQYPALNWLIGGVGAGVVGTIGIRATGGGSDND